MILRPLVALGCGLLALLIIAALAFIGHVAVMPSYLAAWLAFGALPLGALPIVMGLERLGLGATPILPALRRLLRLMPLTAILAIPVLLRWHDLYPALDQARGGSFGWWMRPKLFEGRAIVLLLIWVGLALAFARPAPPGRGRPGLVTLGLIVHGVCGTLAATDWVLSVEPAFTSSAFGLLFLTAQSSMALSLAVALTAPEGVATFPMRGLALAMLSLLAFWAFLEFTQYLVVWSANLPDEVLWYRHRSAGLGQAAEYGAGLLCLLACLFLIPRSFSDRVRLLAWTALALVLLHGLEMLWLVTPAFRSEFSLTLADVLALAGAGGLGIGSVLILASISARRGEARL